MLKFGHDGCLFASAGDNTHPFGDSASYAPIDRRPGREPWNAEKSAANPNDLRGGLIRIKIQPDASYKIPAGNLFPPGTIGTRPEIYVMGCRNPWKFSIDSKSGHLYWGDVGPDAGNDGPRGPRGHDEINQARKPGFFGWPYFIADNKPYSRVDFSNGKVGAKFNPIKPINDSPLNTGRKDLPPAQSAFIFYPYADSPEFPELQKGGRTACAGPVFHYRPEFEQTGGLPAHFDHCLLFWDWNRTFLKWARLDENENLAGIEEFPLPTTIKRPSDALFAPDGTLWFIDYGSTWGDNKDARLVHISYRHGNLAPVAQFTSDKKNGALPLTVSLDGSGSQDPEGGQLHFAWTRQDQEFSTDIAPKLTLTEPGDHLITLKVTDEKGAASTTTHTITAGNTPPTLAFESPLDGSFYTPGKPVAYHLNLSDQEDGDSKKDAAPFAATIVTLAPLAQEAPGLSAIRASDCFNCHHATQKLIGPSFNEIAIRYKDDPTAFDQSVSRVISGSSKVWGDIPMLPHPNLSRDEVGSMIRWISSLSAKSAPEISRGAAGSINLPLQDQTLELSANYTDAGGHNGKASPLSGGTSIRLHPRTIQAVSYTTNNGTQILNANEQPFLGAINHSHWTEYHRFRLDDCQKKKKNDLPLCLRRQWCYGDDHREWQEHRHRSNQTNRRLEHLEGSHRPSRKPSLRPRQSPPHLHQSRQTTSRQSRLVPLRIMTSMKSLPILILLVIISLLTSFARADETNRDFQPVTLMKPLPAIVDAPIQTRAEMEGRINDEELVLGVSLNGSSRAYPINMLNGPSREIINDKLGGKAIAATW